MSENNLASGSGLENELLEETEIDVEKMRGIKKATSEKAGKSVVVTIVAILATVVCVILCFYFWNNAIVIAVDASAEKYSNAKDAKVDKIRQDYWEKGYVEGEEEYHTSNRIVIGIEDVRKTANLEVLKVRDVVYIISNEKDQAWLKATGTGGYTVNLAAGEYLIDHERQYVLVRVPRPELTVNLDSAELMFYKNGSFIGNGSISGGADLARRQLAEAKMKLSEDIKSNQKFNQYAEESAQTLIESLVKKFNWDIQNLEVDVEFFD